MSVNTPSLNLLAGDGTSILRYRIYLSWYLPQELHVSSVVGISTTVIRVNFEEVDALIHTSF